jgi:FkbM family methyltransferase
MTTRSNTRGPLGDLDGMPTASNTVAGRASFIAEKIANRLNELDRLGGRFALRGIPPLAGRALHRCRIPGVGDVTIRQGSSDALVFRQVFRDRQYEFSREAHTARARAAYDEIVARGNTPLVIDCGANVGATALWFAHEYPKAQIVAVEPHEGNATLCRANTAGLRIDTVTAAIGAEEGTVRLITEGGEEWGFQTERDVAGNIPVVTIDNLVAAQGPCAELFMVNVDIEGFESDLFAKNTDWLKQVSVLIVKPHCWLSADAAPVTTTMQEAVAGQGFHLLSAGDHLIYIR